VCTKDTGATGRHHWCSTHRWTIIPRPQSSGRRTERESYIKGSSRITWPDSTILLTTDNYYQPHHTTISRHGHLPWMPTNFTLRARATSEHNTTRACRPCDRTALQIKHLPYSSLQFHPVTQRQLITMTDSRSITTLHICTTCALCPPHEQRVLYCHTKHSTCGFYHLRLQHATICYTFYDRR